MKTFKSIWVLLLVTYFLTLSALAQDLTNNNYDFPILTGPYLGQKPPGVVPEIFAPDVFKDEVHGGLIFSPDGSEIYWDLMDANNNILYMKMESNQWSKPEVVPFMFKEGTGDATFSSDGNRLFFTSSKYIEDGGKSAGENIWYVDRENNSWGTPKPLAPIINSHNIHWQLSVAANGNLYFGNGDIYKATCQMGQFISVEKFDTAINSNDYESTPFIAPDESYLIFSRGTHYANLFISFKDMNGNWTKAVEMDDRINTNVNEMCPNVSPDGKYLFFNRNYGQNGKLHTFWVDTKIIEELKTQMKVN